MKKLLGTLAAVGILAFGTAEARTKTQSGSTTDPSGSYGGSGSTADQPPPSSGGSTDQSGTGGTGTSDSYGGTGGTGTSQGGTAGGTMGQTEAMGQQQIEGRVLSASSKSITVEHMGAAVPFSVSKSTSFQGAKSAKEIKEGQQVRASFELKGSSNQLKSLEVISGTGTTPSPTTPTTPSQPTQPTQPSQPSPGTGGTGSDYDQGGNMGGSGSQPGSESGSDRGY